MTEQLENRALLTTLGTFDFETAGGYTLTDVNNSDAVITEASDGGDYIARTDGANPEINGEYLSPQGSFFFAVQDTDGVPGVQTTTDIIHQTFDAVDISGATNLSLSLLVAEDDSNDGNEDWDTTSALHLEYSIDGSAFQKVLAFEATAGTNTEPAQDTNFDETGDGAKLTPTFTEYTGTIPGAGSSLVIRARYQDLNAGDEDVAIDNLVISGDTDGGPVLGSFLRQNPTEEQTNADSLVFRAIFSEDVQNVDPSDFVVTGTTATATVAQVNGSTYDITISGGDLAGLNGEVGLDLASGQNIQDLDGNNLPADEPEVDEIFIVDNTAPTVSALSPSDDAAGVSSVTDLVVTFDDNIQVGSGNITIHLASNDSVVQTIDVTSNDVSVDGVNLTINPAILDGETEYYVNIPNTAVLDVAGNNFAGILDTTTWSFTTAAETTLTFQQGVNGYAGSFDRLINLAGSVDGSTVDTTTTAFFIDGDPADANRADYLIRFDDILGGSGIPANATILDAQLTLRTTSSTINSASDTGESFSVYRLTQAFDSNSTLDGDFGDNSGDYTPDVDGVDLTEADFNTGTFHRNIGEASITFDEAYSASVTRAVQSWVDGDTNHGLAILSDHRDNDDGWSVHSTGSSVPTFRPQLTVTYSTDANVKVADFQQGQGGFSGTTDLFLRQETDAIDGSSISEGFLDGDDGAEGGSNDDPYLLRFDLASLPDASEIVKAELVIKSGITSGSSDSLVTNPNAWGVHQLLTGFTTESEYSDFAGNFDAMLGANQIAPAVTFFQDIDEAELMSADITSIVENWVINNQDNHGIYIGSHGTQNGWQIFSSGAAHQDFAPLLRITYAESASSDPSFAIAATDAAKDEGDTGTTDFTFTVTRSGDTSAANDVDFAVTGAATDGADAADFDGGFASGTLNFAVGETTKEITVAVNGDTDVEPDEGFIVTLSNATAGATITTAAANGTILDDDAASADFHVTEVYPGIDGSDGTVDWFEITNTGSVAGDIGGLFYEDDSATPTNAVQLPSFALSPGATVIVLLDTDAAEVTAFENVWGVGANVVVFPAGTTGIPGLGGGGDAVNLYDGNTATANLLESVTYDGTATVETYAFDEAGNQSLSAVGVGGAYLSAEFENTSIGGTDNMVALIGSPVDPVAPTVTTLTPADDSTNVSSVDNLVADFTEVVRPGTGSITLHLSNGDIVESLDVSGSRVSFSGTELSIDPVADLMAGTSYYVTIVTGAVTDLAGNAFTGIDDAVTWNFTTTALPEFSIAATDAVKEEGDSGTTEFTFTVTRAGNTTGAATIDYAVTGSGAVQAEGTDFAGGSLPSGQVSFADGETEKVVTINVAGDTDFEPDEGFTVTLSNPSVSATITSAAADGQITNDDTPPVTVIISEVMYNPASTENDWEWVELYNTTTTDIDITGWVIDDNNSSAHAAANIGSAVIAAESTAVLYNVDKISAADFEAAWGTGINLVGVTGWDEMSLGNGGDTIGLWTSFASYSGDNSNQTNAILSLSYDDSDPWPVDNGQASIYLTDLTSDFTIGSNWALSTVGASTPAGGNAYQSVAGGSNGGEDIASPGGTLVTLTTVIDAAEFSEAAGAAATTATITRSGDLSGALTVTLTSDDETEATVPATVTIPANAATVTVNIDAVDDGELDGTQTATIIATATGFISGSDSVDVTDDEFVASEFLLNEIMFNPSGDDTGNEYIELRGTANGFLPADAYIALLEGDAPDTGGNDNRGDLDDVISLAGLQFGADGYLTIVQSGNSFSVDSNSTTTEQTFNLENGSFSVLLVQSAAAPIEGTDYDSNNDGTLDNGGEAWTIADGYGNISGGNDDVGYGPIVTSGDGNGIAAVTIINLNGYHSDYAGRNGDTTGSTQADWVFAEIAGDAPNYTLATDANFVSPAQFAGAPLNHLGSTNIWDPETTLTVEIAESEISENGGSSSVTITRSAADISNALVVTLSVDDGTEASVPATVTIPANAVSATFTLTAIDDAIVDGTQTVSVEATATDFTAGTDTVDVTDDDTAGLTITGTPASIAEDGSAVITITRNTDTTAALEITLSSSDETEATVPATITIPAGEASVDVTITGVTDGIVDGTQNVTITATVAAHDDGTTDVDVTDIDVPGLTLVISPDSISEQDGTTTGTVTRNTDTTGPLTVTLSGSDSTEAAVPASVVIPAGQTSATFTINAVDDALNDGTQTVTVTASATGFEDGTDTLDVTDNDAARLVVTIGSSSISENGGTATGTVTRNSDTTSELVVTLVSDDTTEASVPATVTIPAGATFVEFTITGIDDGLVDGTQTASITASATGLESGSDTIDVTDDDSATLTVTIDMASISENGGTAVGTVTRNTDTTAALVVNLTSSDLSEATVPASVTIPAGAMSVNFNITAVDDSLQDGTQTVTITGAATSFAEGTDTVDVTDDDSAVLTLTIDVDAISENGGSATGTVSRNTDTTADLVVTLTSNDTSEATVPATVTIPAGATSATFAITGVDDAMVDGSQTVTVTATAGGFGDGTDSVDVTDDDTATLTVAIDAASISENGGSTTATVVRNTDTTADLVVTLVSNDTSEATVPATVTIPAGSASATFDITGVDDAIVDGTQTATVTASANTFTSGIDSIDVTDDDVATLILQIDADSISENGGTTTATVTRNTDATASLVVTLASSDTTEAAVPATVTIAAGQTSVTFAVSGVDDSIVDGTQTATITASATGFSDDTDTIDVTDEDTGSLTVMIDSDSISENDGASTATVTRNTGTAGELVVSLSSSDEGEASVPATVTIPDGETSVSFIVSGVDDLTVDGTQTASILASAADFQSGSDDIDVTDDDVATLTVAIDADSITEAGGTSVATVSRNTDTTAELVINLLSDDTSEATVPATVTIPAGAAFVTFTISAVNDDLVDGTQTATVTASATDFADGADSVDVSDDDIATLSLTIDADSVSENGGTTTATVSRNTDSSAELVVNLTSDDPSEATAPASVTIPAGQASVTFDVTGVDDSLLDGTQTATITAAVTGFVSASDTVEVTDDDIAGFTVTETDGDTTVSEDGSTDTFSVVLNAAPVSPVTITVASDDTGEATVNPVSLTFDSSNWDTPQDVTVTGIDDAILDGTQTSTLTISVDDATSDDGFDNLADQTISVETIDNEKVTASITSVSNGEEAGPIDGEFLITLSEAAPTDVTVTYTVGGNASGGNDYNALTGSVTISAGSTTAALPVVVIDDNDDEVTERVTVSLTEGDTLVSPTAGSAEILILDNDFSEIVVSRTSLSVNESGTTETFEVSLSSRPSANVTVEVSVSDATEVSVDQSTLTFTPDNWNTPQTVTATGVDDTDVDGPIASTITLSTVAGSPGKFAGADPVSINVTTADDDSAGPASLNSVTFYNDNAEAERNFSTDSTGQRSMVRRVQVVLDGNITISSADGFSAWNVTTNTNVDLAFVSSTIVDDQTVIVLEFTSSLDAGTGNSSLADGRYEFTVDGGTNFDANGSGSAGGTATFNFHRMFGDSDGDADVDGLDLGAYRAAIRGAAVLDSLFDYDNDGQLFRDLDDLTAFRSRYGRRL